MLYREGTLKALEDLLEDEKVDSLLQKINSVIIEAFGEDAPEIYEIIEEGISNLKKKPMYITDAKIGSSGDVGFAIEYENSEGELEVESAYRETDSFGYKSVSASMLHKLREMAYCGYELRQPKDREVIEVFRDL